MTEQIAPLGTHRFLDQLDLGYHRLGTVRLLANPETIISQVVAGFRLRVDWLWQSPMPATLDVLRELKVL